MCEAGGVRIAVLGPLAMWAADGTPLDVRGVRLRGLLARLALSAGRPVSVETLVDGLWGSEAPSANALQSLVSRLRAGLPATESSVSVQSGPAGYTLTMGADCVDALQFEDLVRRGRGLIGSDPEKAHALLTQAEKLWRGDALADLRDLPFASVEADRLSELRLAAAEDLAEAAVRCGHARDRITELERLAVAHPLRERVHELLIRALYADGRQAEALAAYERVRATLADELGADPGTRLRELHVAVLRGDSVDPVATDGVVPATTAAAPHSNLRAPMTSFVGRREDVAELERLLNNGTRLVTMVGPGGAGKTRLATETGRSLVAQSGDGIWFVELAPLGDAAEVAPAVLSALGATEYIDTPQSALGTPRRLPASRAATERLVDVIADRRVLLVLDNCEHLVQEVAALVDSLLAACPRLRVLTTSREPLSIPGELLHPVGPLGLPPEDAVDDEYPAIQLFVDRARAVRPDFALIDANRGAVAEICRRLDGMPLAIELAAARLRALTPELIVERLADRFRLLTSGSRTALPRHQTLRAVVEWSWELLDPDEQAVARRLSLFSGGATLEAAEQVCSDRNLPPHAILGVLASLVDKSLVEAAAGERSVRYRMLETVRAYGAEQLELAGERERFRHAHDVLQPVAAASQAEAADRRADPVDRPPDRGEREPDRRAPPCDRHRLGARRGPARLGAGRVLEHERPSVRGGRLDAGGARRTGTDLAARPGDGPDAVLDRHAVHQRGSRRELPPGDPRAGRGAVAEPASRVRRTVRRRDVHERRVGDDSPGQGRVVPGARGGPRARRPWTRNLAVMMTAMFRENDGEVDQMAADLSVALDGFRQIGDRWGTSMALRGLSSFQGSRGDHESALESLDEALSLIGELGTTEGVSQLLGQSAAERLELGDIDGARADLARAMQLAEETGSRGGQGMAYLGLSRVAYRTGRLDEAKELGERAYSMLDLEVERMAPQGQAMMLANLSRVHVARKELDEARRYGKQAIELGLSADDMPVASIIVEVLADVEELAGEPELAARTLGMAAAMRGLRTVADADVRAAFDRLQEALGNDAFDAAYDAGASLPRDQVVLELRKRVSSS